MSSSLSLSLLSNANWQCLFPGGITRAAHAVLAVSYRYLSMSKYDAAAFCLEECALHDPMNHILHCRLGEVYYTLGIEYFATARKYFAQSLEIKPKGNARALHGLAGCCHAMACSADKMSREQSGRPEVTAALHEHASAELGALYRKGSGPMAPVLEALLELQRSDIAAQAAGGE